MITIVLLLYNTFCCKHCFCLVICMNGETNCCRHINLIKRPTNGFLTVTCSICKTENKRIAHPKISTVQQIGINLCQAKFLYIFFVYLEANIDAVKTIVRIFFRYIQNEFNCFFFNSSMIIPKIL